MSFWKMPISVKKCGLWKISSIFSAAVLGRTTRPAALLMSTWTEWLRTCSSSPEGAWQRWNPRDKENREMTPQWCVLFLNCLWSNSTLQMAKFVIYLCQQGATPSSQLPSDMSAGLASHVSVDSSPWLSKFIGRQRGLCPQPPHTHTVPSLKD